MSNYVTYTSKTNVVEIPWCVSGAFVGISEEVDWINNVEIRRTVNGAPIGIQSPFKKKMRIRLRAQGKCIRFEPAFDALALLAPITVHSSKYKTNFIPSGATSLVLPHNPVPDSMVIVEDMRGNPVAYTLVNKTVTIAARSEQTVVKYRPVVYCLLKGHTGGAAEIEGAQTWSCEFEEV